MLLKNLYIISIAIAFGCSIINFKRHFIQFKIVSLIIGFDLLGELTGIYLYGLIKTNLPVYNFILLIEFVGYAYFFHTIAKSDWAKKVTIWFVFLFPVFWFVTVFLIFGLLKWNSYVFITGSLLIIFLCFFYYYDLIKDSEIKELSKTPEFWIVTGLLIFYSVNLPFLGMYNYLITYHSNLAENLSIVLQILNIIMYSLFAYAYLCQSKINSMNIL